MKIIISNYFMIAETDNQELNTETHVKTYKRKPKYYCECCKFITDRMSNWTSHLESTRHKKASEKNNTIEKEEQTGEPEKLYKCDKCDTGFDTMIELNDHKSTCKTKIYKCDICNKEYNYYTSYRTHIEYCDKTELVIIHKKLFSSLMKDALRIEDNDTTVDEYVYDLINMISKNKCHFTENIMKHVQKKIDKKNKYIKTLVDNNNNNNIK